MRPEPVTGPPAGGPADVVAVPREALGALLGVYQTWWRGVAVLEGPAGDSLLSWEDDKRMEEACAAVEPYEEQLRRCLAAAGNVSGPASRTATGPPLPTLVSRVLRWWRT